MLYFVFELSEVKQFTGKIEVISSRFTADQLEISELLPDRQITRETLPGIRARELSFVRGVPKRNQAGHEWLARGPENVGGRTRALVIDISNEDVLFAGSVSGGLFRSNDGGRFWSRVSPFDQVPSVSSVVQDTRPGKTHIWYYGTGEARGSIIDR
jgi:hypothetical protein